MDLQNEKCVMVIDEPLPLGIISNTAAIIEFPVHILKCNADRKRDTDYSRSVSLSFCTLFVGK